MTLRLLALVAALPASAVPAAAQSIGVTALQSWSDYETLSSPTGVGVDVHSPPLLDVVRLHGGYTWRFDGREGLGVACTGLIPPGEFCPEEVLKEEFDLGTLALGVVTTFGVHPDVDVRIGVDRTWTRADGNAVGRSTGNEIRPHTPEGRVEGWAVGLDLRWRPTEWRRLNLVASAEWESPGLDACATDSWVPFCGEESIRSIGLGVELDIGRD